MKAVRNLFDAGYPIDSSLTFVAKLFREGQGVELFMLAGYDEDEVERIDQQVDRIRKHFTQKEAGRVVDILKRNWTRTNKEDK